MLLLCEWVHQVLHAAKHALVARYYTSKEERKSPSFTDTRDFVLAHNQANEGPNARMVVTICAKVQANFVAVAGCTPWVPKNMETSVGAFGVWYVQAGSDQDCTSDG